MKEHSIYLPILSILIALICLNYKWTCVEGHRPRLIQYNSFINGTLSRRMTPLDVEKALNFIRAKAVQREKNSPQTFQDEGVTILAITHAQRLSPKQSLHFCQRHLEKSTPWFVSNTGRSSVIFISINELIQVLPNVHCNLIGKRKFFGPCQIIKLIADENVKTVSMRDLNCENQQHLLLSFQKHPQSSPPLLSKKLEQISVFRDKKTENDGCAKCSSNFPFCYENTLCASLRFCQRQGNCVIARRHLVNSHKKLLRKRRESEPLDCSETPKMKETCLQLKMQGICDVDFFQRSCPITCENPSCKNDPSFCVGLATQCGEEGIARLCPQTCGIQLEQTTPGIESTTIITESLAQTSSTDKTNQGDEPTYCPDLKDDCQLDSVVQLCPLTCGLTTTSTPELLVTEKMETEPTIQYVDEPEICVELAEQCKQPEIVAMCPKICAVYLSEENGQSQTTQDSSPVLDEPEICVDLADQCKDPEIVAMCPKICALPASTANVETSYPTSTTLPLETSTDPEFCADMKSECDKSEIIELCPNTCTMDKTTESVSTIITSRVDSTLGEEPVVDPDICMELVGQCVDPEISTLCPIMCSGQSTPSDGGASTAVSMNTTPVEDMAEDSDLCKGLEDQCDIPEIANLCPTSCKKSSFQTAPSTPVMTVTTVTEELPDPEVCKEFENQCDIPEISVLCPKMCKLQTSSEANLISSSVAETTTEEGLPESQTSSETNLISSSVPETTTEEGLPEDPDLCKELEYQCEVPDVANFCPNMCKHQTSTTEGTNSVSSSTSATETVSDILDPDVCKELESQCEIPDIADLCPNICKIQTSIAAGTASIPSSTSAAETVSEIPEDPEVCKELEGQCDVPDISSLCPNLCKLESTAPTDLTSTAAIESTVKQEIPDDLELCKELESQCDDPDIANMCPNICQIRTTIMDAPSTASVSPQLDTTTFEELTTEPAICQELEDQCDVPDIADLCPTMCTATSSSSDITTSLLSTSSSEFSSTGIEMTDPPFCSSLKEKCDLPSIEVTCPQTCSVTSTNIPATTNAATTIDEITEMPFCSGLVEECSLPDIAVICPLTCGSATSTTGTVEASSTMDASTASTIISQSSSEDVTEQIEATTDATFCQDLSDQCASEVVSSLCPVICNKVTTGIETTSTSSYSTTPSIMDDPTICTDFVNQCDDADIASLCPKTCGAATSTVMIETTPTQELTTTSTISQSTDPIICTDLKSQCVFDEIVSLCPQTCGVATSVMETTPTQEMIATSETPAITEAPYCPDLVDRCQFVEVELLCPLTCGGSVSTVDGQTTELDVETSSTPQFTEEPPYCNDIQDQCSLPEISQLCPETCGLLSTNIVGSTAPLSSAVTTDSEITSDATTLAEPDICETLKENCDDEMIVILCPKACSATSSQSPITSMKSTDSKETISSEGVSTVESGTSSSSPAMTDPPFCSDLASQCEMKQVETVCPITCSKSTEAVSTRATEELTTVINEPSYCSDLKSDCVLDEIANLCPQTCAAATTSSTPTTELTTNEPSSELTTPLLLITEPSYCPPLKRKCQSERIATLCPNTCAKSTETISTASIDDVTTGVSSSDALSSKPSVTTQVITTDSIALTTKMETSSLPMMTDPPFCATLADQCLLPDMQTFCPVTCGKTTAAVSIQSSEGVTTVSSLSSDLSSLMTDVSTNTPLGETTFLPITEPPYCSSIKKKCKSKKFARMCPLTCGLTTQGITTDSAQLTTPQDVSSTMIEASSLPITMISSQSSASDLSTVNPTAGMTTMISITEPPFCSSVKTKCQSKKIAQKCPLTCEMTTALPSTVQVSSDVSSEKSATSQQMGDISSSSSSVSSDLSTAGLTTTYPITEPPFCPSVKTKCKSEKIARKCPLTCGMSTELPPTQQSSSEVSTDKSATSQPVGDISSSFPSTDLSTAEITTTYPITEPPFCPSVKTKCKSEKIAKKCPLTCGMSTEPPPTQQSSSEVSTEMSATSQPVGDVSSSSGSPDLSTAEITTTYPITEPPFCPSVKTKCKSEKIAKKCPLTCGLDTTQSMNTEMLSSSSTMDASTSIELLSTPQSSSDMSTERLSTSQDLSLSTQEIKFSTAQSTSAEQFSAASSLTEPAYCASIKAKCSSERVAQLCPNTCVLSTTSSATSSSMESLSTGKMSDTTESSIAVSSPDKESSWTQFITSSFEYLTSKGASIFTTEPTNLSSGSESATKFDEKSTIGTTSEKSSSLPLGGSDSSAMTVQSTESQTTKTGEASSSSLLATMIGSSQSVSTQSKVMSVSGEISSQATDSATTISSSEIPQTSFLSDGTTFMETTSISTPLVTIVEPVFCKTIKLKCSIPRISARCPITCGSTSIQEMVTTPKSEISSMASQGDFTTIQDVTATPSSSPIVSTVMEESTSTIAVLKEPPYCKAMKPQCQRPLIAMKCPITCDTKATTPKEFDTTQPIVSSSTYLETETRAETTSATPEGTTAIYTTPKADAPFCSSVKSKCSLPTIARSCPQTCQTDFTSIASTLDNLFTTEAAFTTATTEMTDPDYCLALKDKCEIVSIAQICVKTCSSSVTETISTIPMSSSSVSSTQESSTNGNIESDHPQCLQMKNQCFVPAVKSFCVNTCRDYQDILSTSLEPQTTIIDEVEVCGLFRGSCGDESVKNLCRKTCSLTNQKPSEDPLPCEKLATSCNDPAIQSYCPNTCSNYVTTTEQSFVCRDHSPKLCSVADNETCSIRKVADLCPATCQVCSCKDSVSVTYCLSRVKYCNDPDNKNWMGINCCQMCSDNEKCSDLWDKTEPGVCERMASLGGCNIDGSAAQTFCKKSCKMCAYPSVAERRRMLLALV